jgi:hypothetical protein
VRHLFCNGSAPELTSDLEVFISARRTTARTLLCEAVVRRLFPNGSTPELAADLEVFISVCAWETVVYTHIASVAMKNYKELFLKHDADCFNAYLAHVKSGKKRIATGALLPHKNGNGVAGSAWSTTCARSAS